MGVAISGGPDSTALLLLAAAAMPGRVEAATVDHGLRSASAAEATAVGDLCAMLGVSHATLVVKVEPGNIQSEARTARYKALAGWMVARGLGALSTAHHADDQAETVLMRLNRASGVGGLAGIRATGKVPGSDAILLRPLLSWRRAELAEIVAHAGIEPVVDPSNSDQRFDRARLRGQIAAADWLDVPAIAASAGHLAEADAALDWAAARDWDEAVICGPMAVTYRPGAPRAVALRVIGRIIAMIGEADPRGGAVARLHDALVRGETATLGGVVARMSGDIWKFRAEKR